MGISRSEQREERLANAELHRIMRRPIKSQIAERRLNAKQVLTCLGISRAGLWRKMQAGMVPPPEKGLYCPPGRDPVTWHGERRFWPASLIYGVAAGILRGPMEPYEWQALMVERHAD